MILSILLSAAIGVGPVESLKQALAIPTWSLDGLRSSAFASVSLTTQEAAESSLMVWAALADRLKLDRKSEWEAKSITLDGKTMKFDFRAFGDVPPPESKRGRSLFISMHGGGETAAKVNDQQWRNQIRLYTPSEGIYLAPRAPTDAWNMWHQPHIDPMFDRIIEDAILFEGIDPNRVYLMGYSAGGDGVYQLAPRMADRFAAASMMAGHPNDASPLGLCNLPFAIHVGALDTSFNRNTIAKDWEKLLDDLAKADGSGYIHHVEVHTGKPHWMDREDASAVPWMMQYTRNPLPAHIVWKQDDVTHTRFYWVACDNPKVGDLLDISRQGSTFTISPQSTVQSLSIYLSDEIIDVDGKDPVLVKMRSRSIDFPKPTRTIAHICESLSNRADPSLICASRIHIDLAPPAK